MNIQSCSVALKEWAVTCHALREGRQLLLLRKGGILDAEGVFSLEHSVFWLQPTYEHQSVALVKPGHQDLFETVEAEREAGEGRKFITLRWLAVVERIFMLTPDDENKLRAAQHIWSDSYLDLRFGYKPERPLLGVAVRLYEPPTPHRVEMREAFFGCRSWIDLGTDLDCRDARPVLDEAHYTRLMDDLTCHLGAGVAASSP